MKDSFTFDDFILFSTSFRSDNEDDIVDEIRKTVENGQDGPDERIINNILDYSRALSVIRTKGTGNMCLLLN